MSEEIEEEIILSELNDEELVQQMHDDLYDGLQEEVVEGVEILLERGWTPFVEREDLGQAQIPKDVTVTGELMPEIVEFINENIESMVQPIEEAVDDE